MIYKSLLIFEIAVVLVGCESYPMGLSKAKWEALSHEQQAEYTRQHFALMEERRKAWEASQQAAEDRRSKEREAENNAAQGDGLYFIVEGGQLEFGRNFEEYQPIGINLRRGEEKTITFNSASSRSTRFITFKFRQDGSCLEMLGFGGRLNRNELFPVSENGYTYGPLDLSVGNNSPQTKGIFIKMPPSNAPRGVRRIIIEERP